jgi:hypothetical protein
MNRLLASAIDLPNQIIFMSKTASREIRQGRDPKEK